MEVADTIAVLNHGRIEQTGSPRQLYDTPRSEFVMRFVGDASEVGGVLVRPHEVDLLEEPAPDAVEALVVRITVLGREVKVELHTTDGGEIIAVLPRQRFDELELWRGQTVWVRPRAERVFSGAER